MSGQPRWNQSDYRIATEALQIEAARLETVLRTAGKDVPSCPAQKGELENYEAMTAHMAQLRALVSLSIPKQSATPATPAPTPAPAQPQTVAKKPLTPDAKILEAHGVKSVSELNAKVQRERDLGLRPED